MSQMKYIFSIALWPFGAAVILVLIGAILAFWDQIKIFLEEVKNPQNTKEAIKLLREHLF